MKRIITTTLLLTALSTTIAFSNYEMISNMQPSVTSESVDASTMIPEENLLYVKVDDSIDFSDVTPNSNTSIELSIYNDSSFSEASKTPYELEMYFGIDENFNPDYFSVSSISNKDVPNSEVLFDSAFLQDGDLLDEENWNELYLGSSTSTQLKFDHTYGSQYSLVQLRNFEPNSSLTWEYEDIYWLAFDFQDGLLPFGRPSTLKVDGNTEQMNIEMDNSISDVFENGEGIVETSLHLNFDENIYESIDETYEDKIISINETYRKTDDEISVDLWNNSISMRMSDLSQISIYTTEEIFSVDSQGNPIDSEGEKINFDTAIANELGLNPFSVDTSAHQEQIDENKFEISFFIHYSTTSVYDTIDNRANELMSDVDRDGSYLVTKLSSDSISRIVQYDSNINFDKYTPASKIIFIIYTILLLISAIALSVWFYIRRRK